MFDRAISSLEFCFNMYCQEYHESLVEAKKLYLILLFRSSVKNYINEINLTLKRKKRKS